MITLYVYSSRDYIIPRFTNPSILIKGKRGLLLGGVPFPFSSSEGKRENGVYKLQRCSIFIRFPFQFVEFRDVVNPIIAVLEEMKSGECSILLFCIDGFFHPDHCPVNKAEP